MSTKKLRRITFSKCGRQFIDSIVPHAQQCIRLIDIVKSTTEIMTRLLIDKKDLSIFKAFTKDDKEETMSIRYRDDVIAQVLNAHICEMRSFLNLYFCQQFLVDEIKLRPINPI